MEDFEKEFDDIFNGDGTQPQEPIEDNLFSDGETTPQVDDDIFDEETPEVITSLLQAKGITDMSKIQIINEEGETEEVAFNQLSLEEQLMILNNEPEISDYEMEVVNFLRESGASLEDIIAYERQKAIEEFQTQKEFSYTVDDLTNEELYKYDLKEKFPTLTDEELDAEIEKELQHPDLFNKKVEILRNEFKELEKAEQEELAKQKELEDTEAYNTLVETMVEVAEGTKELFNLDLEDEDKEEILAFLLEKDINGMSEFSKLLNDPVELFKLAWFAKKGQEAFDVTHDYYKKEIDNIRKQSSNTTRTVTKKPTSKSGDDDPYGVFPKK